jgi:hypothetical protein
VAFALGPNKTAIVWSDGTDVIGATVD